MLEKSKKNNVTKAKSTMRENAAKLRKEANRPKRVRKAAANATKPVSAFVNLINREFHIIKRKGDGDFFSKSRKLTPRYFREAFKELRLVTWPDRSETWRLVFAVFIFSIITGTLIVILDYGLEKVLRRIIL